MQLRKIPYLDVKFSEAYRTLPVVVRRIFKLKQFHKDMSVICISLYKNLVK